MASRRAGRITDGLSRAFIVLAVVLVTSSPNVFDEWKLGPVHVTPSELFFACVVASLVALAVSLSVTPRELLAEELAVLESWRPGRLLRLLPFVLMPIAIVHGHSGDPGDRLALGRFVVTRLEVVQACNLTTLGIWLLLEPLYRLMRLARRGGRDAERV